MTMTFKARVNGINTTDSRALQVGPLHGPKATFIEASIFTLDGQGAAETDITLLCTDSFARNVRIGDVISGTVHVERVD